MGFQGQLSSVSLTDIFQTLHMNRQTGTLSVSSPEGTVHVYFDGGQVAMCDAPQVQGHAFLINALLKKNLLSPEQADDVNKRLYSVGQPLRDLVLSTGSVQEGELDEVCAWCIEELTCPIFEWQQGDFTFTDGAPVPALMSGDVVAMGRVGLQTTQLILEATRRKDEWKRIREVITDADAFYVVDNDGRNNLRNIQTDPDMLKVLRYLDGRHTLDEVANAVGVTRFDTFAISAQLVLAGVARARSPEEVVADAGQLRAAGEPDKAMALLERVLKKTNVPEIVRPLAELCAELKQAPRAVELYLELIQVAQDQGDLDQARKDLDTVLALSPDDPDLQFDRAKVLGELGAIDEAAEAYVAAAQAYIATRDTGRAIDACHRAKNLSPRSPDPHRFLAKAYLLDGQTESALVEYKALWHALLTAERPRRAMEILKQTLETDCRFSNIKEQVLNHAQNSEAIKTSKAMRVLVYVVIGVVVAGAGVAGVEWYKNVIREGQAREDFESFKSTITEKERTAQFQDLFRGVDKLRADFGTTKIVGDLDALGVQLHERYEQRGIERLDIAKSFLASGKAVQAGATLNEIKARFAGTKAADQAVVLLAQLGEDQISLQVNGIVDEAKRHWAALDWDQALATIQPLTARQDLPAKEHAMVAALASDWSARNETAKDLYERAEQYEKAGRKKEALEAYIRATKGKGELFTVKARERLAGLEVEFAQETSQTALKALERGEDKAGFAALDDLAAQAKRATGKGVADHIAHLTLPFVIKLDSHLASLVVKRGGTEQLVRAPAGTQGAWSHRLTYQPTETVTVEARRPGFTAQTIPVSYQARRSQMVLALARGPLWQTDLAGAVGITSPVPLGKFVLLGTNKSTIEVLDSAQGVSKPIAFAQTLDEFKQPPLIFQGQAFSVLENRLAALDITTRTVLWTHPTGSQESPLRLTGSVWVQEHELIPGQILFFLGATKGEILTFARDQAGRTLKYPHIAVGAELTGPLLGDQFEPGRSFLYAPAGSQLVAYDISSATEHSAAAPIFTLRTRGELIGRLARGTVAGRPAILAVDATGLLIACDINPGTPENKRAMGSWALDGQGIGGALVSGSQPVAYVSVGEGRVIAADLGHPGTLLWRFPAQGTVGPLIGRPALGNRGLYIADQQGTLHCIDIQSGQLRWKADLGSPASAGIAALDGHVYVPLRNGQLLCFEEGED
jgi:outer membrane protein assembly factor BamB/tetratricopeptide (TPR) repeat protein